MLSKLCEEVNNYFERTSESIIATITGSTIIGVFDYDYYLNQYIHIKGSILNDGVYKIVSFENNIITVAETLIDEDTDEYCIISGLAIPNTFINLATEITTYENASETGITSESQGNRSVTYSGGTWQETFKKKLSLYKKMRW